jgi:hypothetical protein
VIEWVYTGNMHGKRTTPSVSMMIHGSSIVAALCAYYTLMSLVGSHIETSHNKTKRAAGIGIPAKKETAEEVDIFSSIFVCWRTEEEDETTLVSSKSSG